MGLVLVEAKPKGLGLVLAEVKPMELDLALAEAESEAAELVADAQIVLEICSCRGKRF